MTQTITPEEMKNLESAWMRTNGIPSILLMEQAARGVLNSMDQYVSPEGHVLFLCGPGANGGDGYAAARMFHARGGNATVLTYGGMPQGDALVMRRLAELSGVPCMPMDTFSFQNLSADLVVDALFGTGLTRSLDTALTVHLQDIVRSGIPVLALDIPSGLCGRTGSILGYAMPAVETVTFHRPKQGLFLRNGPSLTGHVTVWPLGLESMDPDYPGLSVMEPGDLETCIPLRRPNSHKGTWGHVAIFAGSPGMAGAAVCCGRGALHAGAGLVTFLARSSLLSVLQTCVPSAMCLPLPEEGGLITPEAIPAVLSFLEGMDCAVAGCGLRTTPDLPPLLDVFLRAPCPVVWDADALNLLSKSPRSLRPCDCITPHPAEAARLLGIRVDQVLNEPLEALRALHQRYGCCVILKGSCTLMTDGTREAVHTLPCPALARGGSGDVLSGILGALYARAHQSEPDLVLLQSAVMVHSLAGLRAQNVFGADGATMDRIIESIRLDARSVL